MSPINLAETEKNVSDLTVQRRTNNIYYEIFLQIYEVGCLPNIELSQLDSTYVILI